MKLFLASSVNTVGSAIVKSLGKKRKILFISTAGELYEGPWWNKKDMKVLRSLGCVVTEYTVTGKNASEIRKELSKYDVLCVGGGNTSFLLYQMKKSGAMKPIRDFVKKGMPYVGSSAGSLLATKSIEITGDAEDMRAVPQLTSYSALGLTDLCPFAHWASTSLDHNKGTLEALKKFGDRKEKFLLLRDDQYIEIVDDFYRIVTV